MGVSPVEPNKLLIAFDKGVLVQWNIATKEVDRFPLDPPVKCFRFALLLEQSMRRKRKVVMVSF